MPVNLNEKLSDEQIRDMREVAKDQWIEVKMRLRETVSAEVMMAVEGICGPVYESAYLAGAEDMYEVMRGLVAK